MFVFVLFVTASAIGCFVCSSVNGSEPLCEDTFNSTWKFYQPECRAGRKGRSGLFPGTECIKMKAEKGRFLHTNFNKWITLLQWEYLFRNIKSKIELPIQEHIRILYWTWLFQYICCWKLIIICLIEALPQYNYLITASIHNNASLGIFHTMLKFPAAVHYPSLSSCISPYYI